MSGEEDDRARLVAPVQTLSGSARRVGFCVLSLSVVAVLVIIAAFMISSNNNSLQKNSWVGGHPPVTSVYRRQSLASLSLEHAWVHLQALMQVATANAGTRAVGTSGFNATVDYVVSQLQGYVGNFLSSVVVQPYSVLSSTTLNATFAIAPTSSNSTMHSFTLGTDFYALSYSGSGQLMFQTLVDVGGMGCDLEEDWADFPAGQIAIVMRGECTFRLKAQNAVSKGAIGLIILNTADTPFLGTLGSSTPLISIPVLGARQNVFEGWELATSSVCIVTNVTIAEAVSMNVIATTAGGNDSNIVVFGSHLDSVAAGPGMNDDASGTAVNLALLRAMAAADPNSAPKTGGGRRSLHTEVGEVGGVDEAHDNVGGLGTLLSSLVMVSSQDDALSSSSSSLPTPYTPLTHNTQQPPQQQHMHRRASTSSLLPPTPTSTPIPLTNRLIFGFWGGEELGLTGSRYYVSQLSEQQRTQIALNYNMDMLGSPNFMRGVFDATSGGPYPVGCAQMTRLIESAYQAHSLAYGTRAFDGRSDYGSFVDAGIAAGGVFTGAEVIKSMTDRDTFGGIANAAYDTCYHQACDTLGNVNQDVLVQEMQVSATVLEFLADDLQLRSWMALNATSTNSTATQVRHHHQQGGNNNKPQSYKRVGNEYVS